MDIYIVVAFILLGGGGLIFMWVRGQKLFERALADYRKQMKELTHEKDSLPVAFGEAVTIYNDAAYYWHLNKLVDDNSDRYARSLKYELFWELLERLNSDDLLELAVSNIREGIPLEKASFLKLNTALDELANRREWRHLSFVIPEVSGHVPHRYKEEVHLSPDSIYLGRAIKETTKYQLSIFNLLFCKKHLHRFVRVWSSEIEFAVCRKCNGSQWGIKVKRIVLLFTRSASWKTCQIGGYLWVNGLFLDALCDFERIVIGNCTDDDIERFCILVGNDTDAYRVDRYWQIRYRILKDSPVTDRGIGLLNRFFRPKT